MTSKSLNKFEHVLRNSKRSDQMFLQFVSNKGEQSFM